MSGYRDDEEAQRMRVASLEERLAELEAENEALREREAEVEAETPMPFDLSRHVPPAPGVASRPSKDVEDTLASLKAMGEDMARREAEKSREDLQSDPVVKLAKMTAKKTRPYASPTPPADTVPLVSLGRIMGPSDSELREQREQEASRAAYWNGVRDAVLAMVFIVVCIVVAVMLRHP